jgi:XTP/dITP diphosphohydrolase
MARLVLATCNAGKLKEFRALCVDTALEIIPQTDFSFEEAIEDGLSFVENAIIKARHAAKRTGLPALADDSGLAVDALKGAPGIYSARYAGSKATDASNREMLLKELQGETERTARFHCVLVYMANADDPCPIIVSGVWEGWIAEQSSGEDGFGYDPLFFVPIENCTAAELSAERKNSLSHRGKALRHFQEHHLASIG